MKISIIRGDITQIPASAIVNAANPSLSGGGGVDGAIHRAAGPELLESCRQIVATSGFCRPGTAVYTPAFGLSAQWVIHTVGPIWKGGRKGEPEILQNCYRNSLLLAASLGAVSVSFPAISTGVYAYPPEDAVRVVAGFFRKFKTSFPLIGEVRFVCYDFRTYALYIKHLHDLLPDT